MQSLKLNVRFLCAVGLSIVTIAACGDLTATSDMSMAAGGSSNSNNSPGSSGSATTPTSGGDSSMSVSGSAGSGTMPDGGNMLDASNGGSGGSAGASTGGSAGSSAGSGSAGTGTIVDPCTHTGPRTRTDLTPTNGRVDCTTNDFGIEGDWKLNSSDPQLMTVDFTGSNVCGKGQIAQVVSTPTSGGQPDFGRYWGGGLAFVMQNETPGAPALPYDANFNGLLGISATISGATIPAEMRFKFKMIGSNENYCLEVTGATSGQTITLHTGDAVHNCWAPDNTSTLNITMIENYEVQVVSQTTEAVPFDFCLTNITALSQ